MTGLGLIFISFQNNEKIISKLILSVVLFFFILGVKEHIKELKIWAGEIIMNRENIKLIIGAVLAASITWILNHKIGLGPIVANGLIGVVVSLVFSQKLAGAYYVASFIGMSANFVIPTALVAGIAGLLSGFVIILTQSIYGGIGGKGGTIAAFSTQLIRVILILFI